MDAQTRQLVEALILARLALDHVDALPVHIAEIARAKEMAEAAIRAAIKDALERATLSNDEDKE